MKARLLAAGAAGLLACLLGLSIEPRSFFLSYLVAYLFWLGLALGSLALLMLHHLVAGRWGFFVQRILEAAAGTLPTLALLFVPLLFGMRHAYPWVEEAMGDRAAYLNEAGFVGRAVLYLAIWVVLALLVARGPAERAVRVAAPGLVLYFLSISFAAMDWVMSLDPHWYSTIFGLLFVVAQGLAGLALAIVTSVTLRHRPELERLGVTERLHDLGKLLFGFVMLWGYVHFAQFLIIWSADLPEEVGWLAERMHGGWGALTLLLVVVQLGVPFFVLLTRYSKRHARLLRAVGYWLLAAGWLHLLWLVRPGMRAPLSWLDLAALVGVGAVWLLAFTAGLSRRPLVPHDDPRFSGFRHAAH